jgi:hypothetical protein
MLLLSTWASDVEVFIENINGHEERLKNHDFINVEH